jgi:hypothetical protein
MVIAHCIVALPRLLVGHDESPNRPQLIPRSFFGEKCSLVFGTKNLHVELQPQNLPNQDT